MSNYYFTTYDSPIDTLTLGCDNDNNLVGLWMKTEKYVDDSIFKYITEKSNMPVFNKTKKWLDNYFAGANPPISELPLAPIGGEFRQNVWDLLCQIPYGELVTYGDISKKIVSKMKKKAMSAQAVGGAVGHNPISIIIPCHRVVGANGNLTGFGGGINRKIKLLEIEGVDMSNLYIPKKGTAL